MGDDSKEPMNGLPPPDMKAAWEFYETYTLPRRILKEGTTDDYRKLEPGEIAEGSGLYGVWETPVDEIGDFGLGVYLYFKMLITLVGCMAVCIALNIPAMQHYTSSDYPKADVAAFQLSIGGNAVCDKLLPVCMITTACTCATKEFDITAAVADKELDMYSLTSETGECAYRAACTMKWDLAYYDASMLGFLVVGLFLLARLQNAIVEEADEAEQTAQDYSIIVNDPDADAVDPDEWQQFFQQFGHVTYVTVAIDNGVLVQKLADRRLMGRMIAFETATDEERASMFDPTENDSAFDQLSGFKKKLIGAGLSNHISFMRKKITKVDAEITELLKKEYSAVKVFVVFETEAAQRSCLKEMTVGTIPALLNQATNIPEHQRFRKENILSVSEAPEPTDVIWVNLETTMPHMIKQTAFSMTLTVTLVAILGLAIWQISESSPSLAGFFVAACNGGLPAFMKALNETEEHLTQGSRQSSLLLKLVLSRWFTAAIITWVIRGFSNTIRESFLTKAAAILFADAFTTPIIRMMDPGGRVARNVSAKSAKTQAKMNSFFTNTAWFLAERYTDMTKSLFVGLFYSALYPGGLVWTTCSFIMCYWVDKYCLFRLWKQPPAMDASLTAASRLQIAVVCVAHSVIAGLFFAGFPFDNLHMSSDTATVTELKTMLNGNVETITHTNANVYTFVDQKPQGMINVQTQDWMSSEQVDVVKMFSIINICVVVLVCIGYFGKTAAFSVYKLFYGEYIPVGDPNPDLYSFVPGIESYIPMYQTDKLPLPLLACNLELIDKEHISFTADYSKQDLTKDAVINKAVENGMDVSKCFSICKQYKSPELIESENKQGK
ncbi:hypothetical protein TL16_g00380 [Triparma laevis f. inornata]|uniref:CSC1/OSCA1-like cytosolic domain-containing protein n=1 Tax=Triparma laevis f. inornata TaxID=1714386 RepID=A0A9W7DS72_9STRA|nr:hypothetical protein TL16_g00380 [Triparma laevis f. inornata]